MSEYSESGRRLAERKRTWRVSRASGCVAACASTSDGDVPTLVEAHETENIKYIKRDLSKHSESGRRLSQRQRTYRVSV